MVTYIKDQSHIGTMEDKSEMIKIYLSEDLKDRIQDQAEEEDLTISSFGRSKLKKEVEA